MSRVILIWRGIMQVIEPTHKYTIRAQFFLQMLF